MSESATPHSSSLVDASVPLDSILCTEELRRRPSRLPGYEKESAAVVALAKALADAKPDILQTLAETILDVIGCDSSGLSLLTDGGRQLYWPAIAGEWKLRAGRGVPRDSSPCGDALDRGCALLFRRFERRYTAFQQVMPPAEECLTVPFYGEGKAVGTMWAILHADRRKFDAEDQRLMTALGHFAAVAYRQRSPKPPRPDPEEQDFRLMIDSIPTLVYTTTPAGEVEFVNRQVLEYFGRTAGELKGWDKLDCVHPDDLSRVIASLNRSVEFSEPHEVQQRLRRADGVYRWFQSRTRPLRDERGRLVRWFAALTDIEDVKQAEAAVGAEADLRQLVNGVPGLVVTMTAEGEIESANEKVLSYTGRTVEQFKHWPTLLHPEDRTQTLDSWRRSLETGGPSDIEARILGADGVYRWFQQRGVPQVDADGRPVRWYVLLTEIDQHKRLEERLRESEAFLLDAQRLSHTGSWKHDLATNAVSVTPEIIRIYAIAPHEDATTAEFYFGRVHPDDTPGVAASYAQSIADKRDFASDFRIVLGDGSIRYIRNTGHPKFDEAGELVEVLGTAIDVTEQTLARAELRAIINAIPTLAWSAGPDGSCDFLNQRWLDFTGLSAEQALGFGWSVVIHPGDAPGLLAYWQSALAAGTHVDVEARVRRFDGAYRWFLFRADPLRDEAGQIVKWYGTNTDIEDRKRAEDKVRLNEQNLRAIINTIPTLSWSTRPDGYVEFLSERWLDFTGLSVEQAEGFGWTVAIHPEDAPGLGAYWQAALASGSHVDVEARLRRFDGVYRWLLFRADPLRDEFGQIVKWYGTNFDIEGRKLAEEALRASEQSLRESEHDLRLIIDSIPALVCVMGPRGGLEAANLQAFNYYGKSVDGLKNWGPLVHRDDLESVTAIWLHSVETGEPYNAEMRLRRADGVYRWFQVRGLPLRDPQGSIVRWSVLQIDVEDRHRAEEALRASEHNLRLIFDTIPALVCTMSAQGDLELINRQTYEYFGIPLDALKDWSLIGAVHPEDLDGVVARWRHSIETGERYDVEHRIRRADGVYRWFHVSALPLRDSAGRIVWWYVLLVDAEDRRRAEEALRASEHNFRLIFDHIPALVCTMSPHGEVELVNRQLIDYFGKPLDELRDWSKGAVHHPEDLERVISGWRRSVETGQPHISESRMRRGDGVYRWFRVSGLPLRDPEGRIVRWYVLLIDSEERHRAELALRASELNLRQLTETIPGMLFSATPEGVIDYCNAQVFSYTSLPDEGVLGDGWLKALHPEDAERVGPIWLASVATGEPYQVELRALHADGAYRWCTVSALPLLDEHGRILKWHGTIVDIHDARVAEEKLRRNEEYFAEAQRLSHTGSFGGNLSTDEHLWSDETFRIFGFDPSVKISLQAALDRFHPDDLPVAKEALAQAIEGEEFRFEARWLMPEGHMKYTRFIGHGTKGRADGYEFIGAVQDVTEQRLAEQALTKVRSELAHVSRVTSLGTLTASIAHEVNQPLAAVIASADSCTAWLAVVPPNLDKARVAADRVIQAAAQASAVVQRIRTMIKNTSPSAPAVLKINDIVEEALSLIRTEIMSKRVSLHLDLAEDLPAVSGDRVQITQVVLNLAMNGIEAMAETDDGGRSLSIKTASAGQTGILISVADNGPGLDANLAAQLFDPFFTTKAAGMGMGLSISRSIIEAHAGRLWAAANEPGGAVFHFTLPATAIQ